MFQLQNLKSVPNFCQSKCAMYCWRNNSFQFGLTGADDGTVFAKLGLFAVPTSSWKTTQPNDFFHFIDWIFPFRNSDEGVKEICRQYPYSMFKHMPRFASQGGQDYHLERSQLDDVTVVIAPLRRPLSTFQPAQIKTVSNFELKSIVFVCLEICQQL